MDLKNRLDHLKRQAEKPKTPKPTTDAGPGNKWVMDDLGNWKQVPISKESYEVEKTAAIDDILFSLADGEELQSSDFGCVLSGFINDGLVKEVKEPQTLNARVANKINRGLKFYAATEKLFDVVVKKISSLEEEFEAHKPEVVSKDNFAKAVRQAAMNSINFSKKNLVINARTNAVLGTLVRQSKNGLEVKNSSGKVSIYWPQEVK